MAVVHGEVIAFDEHKGYGTVRAADGRELFFHCTAIADGTRTIEVGTPVTFEVVPSHRMQWEATALREGSAWSVSGDQSTGSGLE